MSPQKLTSPSWPAAKLGMYSRIYHDQAQNIKFLKLKCCLNFFTVGYLQVNKIVNPCPAELFQLYFSSFEAGIANAISSFK